MTAVKKGRFRLCLILTTVTVQGDFFGESHCFDLNFQFSQLLVDFLGQPVLWQQDGILNLYRLQMPARSDFSNQII